MAASGGWMVSKLTFRGTSVSLSSGNWFVNVCLKPKPHTVIHTFHIIYTQVTETPNLSLKLTHTTEAPNLNLPQIPYYKHTSKTSILHFAFRKWRVLANWKHRLLVFHHVLSSAQVCNFWFPIFGVRALFSTDNISVFVYVPSMPLYNL